LKPEHSRQYGKNELSRITTVTWVWFLKKSDDSILLVDLAELMKFKKTDRLLEKSNGGLSFCPKVTLHRQEYQ